MLTIPQKGPLIRIPMTNKDCILWYFCPDKINLSDLAWILNLRSHKCGLHHCDTQPLYQLYMAEVF